MNFRSASLCIDCHLTSLQSSLYTVAQVSRISEMRDEGTRLNFVHGLTMGNEALKLGTRGRGDEGKRGRGEEIYGGVNLLSLTGN